MADSAHEVVEEAVNDWPLEDERLFWQDICAPGRHPDSYWWFLNIAMGYALYMEQPENPKWLTERVHKPFAAWIQDKIDRYIRNVYAGRLERIKAAPEMPRGTGKSQCVTIPAPLYLFLEFPDLAWGNGSENKDKAAELFLDSQRAILEGSDQYSWFTWLYGAWLSANAGSGMGRRPSRKHFLVHNYRRNLSKKDKSLFCWGVGSGLTGKHPEGGTMDDPVSEETLREEANWLDVANKHMDSMFYAFLSTCLLFFPHTRYRINDPGGERWRKEGIKRWDGMPCPDELIREKYIREDGQWEVYFLDIRDEDGNSILPEIYTTEMLNDMEASDPMGFAAQMRNQPGSGEHALITRDQVQEIYISRDKVPKTGRIYFNCDTAFKSLSSVGKGDETVCEVHLHDPKHNGVVYYLEGFGDNRYRIENFSLDLVKLIHKYQTDEELKEYKLAGITDELTGSGKRDAWFAYLRQFAAGMGVQLPPLIELNRGGKKKDSRVVRHVGYMLDGRYRIVRGARGANNVISQAVRYHEVRNQKDDWIDASADSTDKEIYHTENYTRPGAKASKLTGQPSRTGPRFRRLRENDAPVWDEKLGIYDTIEEPDVV